jgi:hypothetical protein
MPREPMVVGFSPHPSKALTPCGVIINLVPIAAPIMQGMDGGTGQEVDKREINILSVICS